MRQINWKVQFGFALTAVTLVLLATHFMVWHDWNILTHDLFFYMAIIPVQVVVTTLILDEMLEMRDRRERLEKMNMVIGLFFSEIGVELLRQISARDKGMEQFRSQLLVDNSWTQEDIHRSEKSLAGHQFIVHATPEDLDVMKVLLSEHRSLMVQLLENPILLEHETFTNLLRAVFHLAEELDYRKSLEGLPLSDYAHLSGDTSRAYGLLAKEWLSYMKYLKVNYPYLFSLSMRTNPFDLGASPVVKG
jgi:hypothetical protein